MTLGEKIYRLRTEQGFSQETFGEKLGVSRQSVSKWETDQSVPELDKIVAISEIFGVSTDYLLKYTEETHGTADEAQPQAGKLVREVYRRDRRTHFEYKSERMIGNLPLVHINLGIGVRPAKGVIAIGTIAQGWLAIGFASMGGFSVGIVSLGLLSLANFAFGLICFRHSRRGRDQLWCFLLWYLFSGSSGLRPVRLWRIGSRRAGGDRRCGERKDCAGVFPGYGHLYTDQ